MTDFNEIWTTVWTSVNGIEVDTISSVFKMCLSLVLGSIVGIERKRKGQIAGVRTFALISMGATLAMLLSIYLPQEYLGLKNGDPGRIAAQVVTGIGFLGAGAIIQMKGSVRGLTTAAGIWMVAAIGMAVGVGLYTIAIVATALILFILVQLERFEHRVKVGSESRIIRMKLSLIIGDMEPYKKLLADYRIQLSDIYVEYDYNATMTHLNMIVLVKEKTDYIKLFSDMKEINSEYTLSISLANQVNI